MTKLPYAVIIATLLAACASVPRPAPTMALHDLGGVFPAAGAHSTLPLRTLAVSAQPVVNTVSMQYREAGDPTQRKAWTFNRWASSPAAMTEAALNRLLASSGAGRCRLQVTLGEFIVDIDAQGRAHALLSADLRLLTDEGAQARTAFDLQAPLPHTDPATAAAAFRQAVTQLGSATAGWLAGPAGRACTAG